MLKMLKSTCKDPSANLIDILWYSVCKVVTKLNMIWSSCSQILILRWTKMLMLIKTPYEKEFFYFFIFTQDYRITYNIPLSDYNRHG